MIKTNWFKKLLELAPKSSFAKGASVLVAGNLVAQSLVLLATPLLTRLYSPAEFGLLALFTSITLITGSIVCGRYELAIGLSDNQREASAVAIIAMVIAVIVAPVTALIFLTTPWAKLLTAQGYSTTLIFLGITIATVLVGFHTVYRYWGLRQEKYSLITQSRIIQSIARIATQCSFYVGGATTLIVSSIASTLIGLATLKHGLSISGKVSSTELRSALVRYRRFPLYSTWSAALNTTGRQLPVFAFIALFGVAPAGLYALAERIIAAPVSMVSTAVSGAFLSESVKSMRNNTLAALVRSTHNQLSNVALAPFLMLAIIAPVTFEFLFGKEWTESGIVASWVSLYLYFSFVAAPLTMLFRTLEKQDSELKIQITVLIARLMAIFLGAKLGGFIHAVACYSIVSSLYYIYLLKWICTAVDLPFMVLVKHSCRTLLWAILTTSPCALALLFDWNYGVPAGVIGSVFLMGWRFIHLRVYAHEKYPTTV